MSYIQARSPYIVSINEALQVGSKVELFLWNGTGAAPTLPQYTLSKLIPASNNLLTTYNISPYIREFIKHSNFNNNYNVGNDFTPINEFCNVKIKRFKKTTLGTYSIISTINAIGVDGYGEYQQGFNPDNGRFFLDQPSKMFNGKYYYNYNTLLDPLNVGLDRAGIITMDLLAGEIVQYEEIGTGAIYQNVVATSGVYDMLRVYPSYYTNGNRVTVIDLTNTPVAEWYFIPQIECRYEPVVIDFINRLGGWQREFFFKASNTSIGVEGTDYNLLQSNLVNYSVLEGQRSVFNLNGKEVVKCNSGYVTQNFNVSLKQLMLSERILVDNRPAKLNTKSIELQKNINNKMINYQVEFEFANDIINSVV